MLAAGGAGDSVFVDISFHLFRGESVHRLGQGDVVCLGPTFDDLVGAETLFAFLAVHERIGKTANVAGSNPDLGIHQNSGIKPNVVGAFLDEFFPPCLFNVVLQFHAQRAIVPGVGKAAINFGACENKAPIFAEGDDLIHSVACHM